jgi:hypothetical protein
MKRINGEWRTETTLVTDSEGIADLCGFRGDYTAAVNGLTADFTLDGKSGEVKVALG